MLSTSPKEIPRTQKINLGWPKWLDSEQLQTLMTPKIFFTKTRELCWGLERATQKNRSLPTTTKITEKLPDQWKDLFVTLRNELSKMEQHEFEIIEQSATQHWMFKRQDLEEVSKIISMLIDEKNPCVDGLQPSVTKSRGSWLIEVHYTIIKYAWENLELSPGWKDPHQVTIIKKRGKWHCVNCRRISLLSISRIVLSHILHNRLSTLKEDFLTEKECGFHSNWTTTDMISLPHLHE